MKQAIVIAAVCEFTGSVLMGAGVTSTIRKGIADVNDFVDTVRVTAVVGVGGNLCRLQPPALLSPCAAASGLPRLTRSASLAETHAVPPPPPVQPDILMYGMLCALLASGIWLLIGEQEARWMQLVAALSCLLLPCCSPHVHSHCVTKLHVEENHVRACLQYFFYVNQLPSAALRSHIPLLFLTNSLFPGLPYDFKEISPSSTHHKKKKKKGKKPLPCLQPPTGSSRCRPPTPLWAPSSA